VVQYLKIFVSY